MQDLQGIPVAGRAANDGRTSKGRRSGTGLLSKTKVSLSVRISKADD
jgi:hypothetical protein